MRRRTRRSRNTDTELNITAFLNLMVILIPFLLITAVFSRITILELSIPPVSNETPPPEAEKPAEEPVQINIVVRPDVIVIADNKGFARNFRKVGTNDFDFKAISDLLRNMKDKVPDKKDANVLVDPDVSYELLVHIMDTVRAIEFRNAKGIPVQQDMFPEISLGDAPPLNNGNN